MANRDEGLATRLVRLCLRHFFGVVSAVLLWAVALLLVNAVIGKGSDTVSWMLVALLVINGLALVGYAFIPRIHDRIRQFGGNSDAL